MCKNKHIKMNDIDSSKFAGGGGGGGDDPKASKFAESERNHTAAHVKFGDDSALNALTRGQ